MNEKTKHKRKILILLLLLLLLLITVGIIIFWQIPSEKNPLLLDKDKNAVEWNGNQPLPQGQQDGKGIAIPGFKSLVFTANTTTQKVNFENPECNEGILFLETLYVDDSPLWQSGYFGAGTGFYEIELSEPLTAGEYSAYLKIECFRESGETLNGAKVEFDLTVQ